jgi:RecA-family ATPase
MSPAKPVFRAVGNGYEYTWAEEQVVIQLDRFHEDKSGLTCELVVYDAEDPENRKLMHSARFNLASGGTRKSVVGMLEKRDEKPDWFGMFEQLCSMSREQYRLGEPTQDLRVVEPYKTEPWFLFPYLRGTAVTTLTAYGGIGKSFIALGMAASVATGKEIVGRPYAKATPVLYLDYEADAETHATRLAAITAGAGLAQMPEIYYRFCTASLMESVDTAQREISRLGIGMVVVDSLGAAGSGAPEEGRTAIPLMSACRSFKVPTLAIHHRPKPQNGQKEGADYYGSIYYWNHCRMMWVARLAGKADDDEKTCDSPTKIVELKQVKTNDGARQKKHGLKMTFENAGEHLMALHFESESAQALAHDPDASALLKLPDRLLIALERGPQTAEELADRLKANRKSVQNALGNLKEQGLVIQLQGSRWGPVDVRARER